IKFVVCWSTDRESGTGFSYSSDERDLRQNEENDLYDFLQVSLLSSDKVALDLKDFTCTSFGVILANHSDLHKFITQFSIFVSTQCNFVLCLTGHFSSKHPQFQKNDFYITGESYAGHYIPAFASTVNKGNKNKEGILINLQGVFELSKLLELATELISCSPTVYSEIQTDWMKKLAVGIPALLNYGIQFLAYDGEYDLICNWFGSSNLGSRNGMVRELKNHGPLSFLKVHDAGHMVPMDQPKAALEMLKRWTPGKLTAEAAAPGQTQNHHHLIPSVL
ncbi:hypothetical protein C5167_042515, partial [Papaver somniferum]